MVIGNIHRVILLFCTIAVFIRCENQKPPQLKTDINHESIKGSVWLSVDENGKPKIENLQKCKLVFLNNNEYEIKRTFVYSNSSYRNPGIYEIRDSVVVLKSLNGQEIYGNLYIHENNEVLIKWEEAALFGDGTEILSAQHK
jgi:hypothetical protein